MEWVERLGGRLVALDTAPPIYLIERPPRYLRTIRPFFRALARGESRAVTSTITLMDVRVQPLRQGDGTLVRQYHDLPPNARALAIRPVSIRIAAVAARLRARYRMLPRMRRNGQRASPRVQRRA